MKNIYGLTALRICDERLRTIIEEVFLQIFVPSKTYYHFLFETNIGL